MIYRNATDDFLPPYIVYKANRTYIKYEENGPNGTKYACTLSEWFNMCTFENWYPKILLPYAKWCVCKKVLIYNNVSEKVIEKCKKHDIKFIFLSPNSTHITPSLDVAFFGPIKKYGVHCYEIGTILW